MKDRHETAYRADLAAGFRRIGVLAQPIETGGTGDGVPDLFIACGKAVWIEVKKGALNGNKINVTYRPGQKKWLQENAAQGGISIVHVVVPSLNKHYVFRNRQPDSFLIEDSSYNLKLEKINYEIYAEWLRRQ